MSAVNGCTCRHDADYHSEDGCHAQVAHTASGDCLCMGRPK